MAVLSLTCGGVAAFTCAIALAYFGHSLLIVASGSAVAVFICELIYKLL